MEEEDRQITASKGSSSSKPYQVHKAGTLQATSKTQAQRKKTVGSQVSEPARVSKQRSKCIDLSSVSHSVFRWVAIDEPRKTSSPCNAFVLALVTGLVLRPFLLLTRISLREILLDLVSLLHVACRVIPCADWTLTTFARLRDWLECLLVSWVFDKSHDNIELNRTSLCPLHQTQWQQSGIRVSVSTTYLPLFIVWIDRLDLNLVELCNNCGLAVCWKPFVSVLLVIPRVGPIMISLFAIVYWHVRQWSIERIIVERVKIFSKV